MTYNTTITQKGQITIPKQLRDTLDINTSSKIVLELTKDKTKIILKTTPDILDLAGRLKVKKTKSALKTRGIFEKKYKRA